mgnify:CR=1 FL=1
MLAKRCALSVAAAGAVEIQKVLAADDDEGLLPIHFGVGEHALGIGQRTLSTCYVIHGIDRDVLHAAELVERQALADHRTILGVVVDKIANRHKVFPPLLHSTIITQRARDERLRRKIFSQPRACKYRAATRAGSCAAADIRV